MNCGLGNNGGSQTIVQSANMLSELGNDVSIIDSGRNKHTWNKLKVKHIIIKDISHCPKCDVIIGTGIKTFDNVVRCKKADRKFHWIRGWETWQIPHKRMLDMFKSKPQVNLLTNGTGIRNILKQSGLKSKIQLAGLDNCIQNVTHDYKKSDVLRIGGLINTRHKTKQTNYILKVFKYLKNILDNVELYTYGNEILKSKVFSDHHHCYNPTVKLKNKIYRKVDFWLSPSISEGFHIPPAEYMLTGGVVVGVKHPLNGTDQYLKNNNSGFTCDDNWRTMADIIINNFQNYELLNEYGNNAYNTILHDIGSRRTNMKKFIKILKG